MVKRLTIAGAQCVFLLVSLLPGQAAEQVIWPRAGRILWYWVIPKTDLGPEQIDAIFKQAIAEEMAFVDPGFEATLFFAKNIRLSKGKSKDRKKYHDRPEKADDLRIEAEWQNGYLNQNRGRSYCYIALDAVRSLDLHFLPNMRERFPKAPEGRNWNVNILTRSRFSFFFALEDSARSFINAMASALTQRGLGLTFSRFGLMWENVTPAQAADMGPIRTGWDGRPLTEGVLITMVAVAGPADRAGIRPLDAILEVNGTKVKNFSHFSLLLDGVAPGTKATLVLLRRLKEPHAWPEPTAWNPLTVEMETLQPQPKG